MQLEKSTPITGGKTSFLQRINQQIPFVSSNLKFMSGLSLIVFGTVLQLALKNSTSKAGTVFKVIGGMCIFGGLIVFLLSLNYTAIKDKFTQTNPNTPQIPKELDMYCFAYYVRHPKTFYIGLLLSAIGFLLPGIVRKIKEMMKDDNTDPPKIVNTLANMAFGIGLVLLFWSFNYHRTEAVPGQPGVSRKLISMTTLLVVLGIGIVLLLVYGYCVGIRHKAQIQANWPTYRCKPYIIPIASFVGPPGTSTSANASACFTTMTKEVFNVFMHPWASLLSLIKNILHEITMDIQDIRKMIFFIRNTIVNALDAVANKTYDAYYRISVLFNMIRNLLMSIFYVLRGAMYVLAYAFSALGSIMNGPIGGMMRFFCFDPDTPITMKDGSIKPIYEIQIGDILYNDNEVLAVMKFKSCASEMYLYRGTTLVAGTHLVSEFGKWIRVEDSQWAEPIKQYNGDHLFCLHTSNNEIWTNEIKFADYFETNDRQINKTIQEIILSKLNRKAIVLENEVNNCWGVSFEDLLQIKEELVGVIQMKCVGQVYRLNNVICSGEQIVLWNGEYKQVCSVEDSIPIKWDEPLYNVCTREGTYNLGGLTFVDFEQEMSEDTNTKIDLLVSNHRNSRCADASC